MMIHEPFFWLWASSVVMVLVGFAALVYQHHAISRDMANIQHEVSDHAKQLKQQPAARKAAQ